MNYSRNYYIMSHGKLICECWTLLHCWTLQGIAGHAQSRGDVNSKAELISSPASWRESFPGERGRQDGESCMASMPWHRFGAQEKNIYQPRAGFVSSDVAG